MTTIELISSSTAELRRLVNFLKREYPPAGYGTMDSWEHLADGRWKVTVKFGSAD